jgi:phage-related protein
MALLKPVEWVGSSREDLRAFPAEVREVMGEALYRAQQGGNHPAAKPLKGFGGRGVLEIVDRYHTDTYRVIYTVKFMPSKRNPRKAKRRRATRLI